MIKQIFYLVQPSPVRYTLKTRGSQRLKACWKRWVFRPHQNRALDVVGKCKCSVPDVQSHNVEAPFEEFRGCPQHGQVTASSRAETGMQTCWKYAGPAPWTQVNLKTATLNCICWGTGSQCCNVLILATASHHTSGGVHNHLQSSNDLRCGSVLDGVAAVDSVRNERGGQCLPRVEGQWPLNDAELTELVEAVPHDTGNMWFHRQFAVNNDAKVAGLLERQDAVITDCQRCRVDLR